MHVQNDFQKRKERGVPCIVSWLRLRAAITCSEVPFHSLRTASHTTSPLFRNSSCSMLIIPTSEPLRCLRSITYTHTHTRQGARTNMCHRHAAHFRCYSCVSFSLSLLFKHGFFCDVALVIICAHVSPVVFSRRRL
jgi:hypothetical protein